MTTSTAIVTGGSAGIGVAICRALLDKGYEVISLARRKAGIASPRLRSVTVDLSDPGATRQAVEEIARQHAVTTIVHNAGAMRERPLEQVDVADLDVLVGPAPRGADRAATGQPRGDAAGALRPRRARVDPRGARAREAHRLLRDQGGPRWASRAPGRSSSGRRGSPSTSSRPGRSARRRCSKRRLPKDSPKLPRIIQSIPVRRLGRPRTSRARCSSLRRRTRASSPARRCSSAAVRPSAASSTDERPIEGAATHEHDRWRNWRVASRAVGSASST